MRDLSYLVAWWLAELAQREAEILGVPMAVSVVDAEGGPLTFVRMEGALPASTDIAAAKAYTAAALRLPSHEVGRLAQPGGVLYGIQHTLKGRIILFGGGMPLTARSRVVGAIGISGGSVDEDMIVARATVRAFEEMTRWAEWLRQQGEVFPVEAKEARRLSGLLTAVLSRLGCRTALRSAHVLSGALWLAQRSAL